MSSFRVRLMALAAAFALTTSCSSQSGTPTTNDATTATTTSAQTTVSSSSSATNAPTSATVATPSGSAQPTSSSEGALSTLASSGTTLDEAAESEAALTAYRGYYEFLTRAYADPSADWSSELKQWATGPAADQTLSELSSMARLGQYATGTVQVEPKISQVQPALVDIDSCVDTTNVGLFNRDGQSIKSPDAPGTYFRAPSKAQVGQFEGGAWLVVAVVDDHSVTC